MIHELFHRIQDEIGFPGSNPANNHLDSFDGRLWLQLEWRALQKALTGQGARASEALIDALVFREHRRAIFAGSSLSERGLEMNEGLAEYTGAKLRGTTDVETADYMARSLEAFERRPTFARSFAYATGPAYGLLLDRASEEWRKGLKPTDDFGALAERLYSIKLPKDLKREAERRAVKYDGESLQAAETERENRRRNRTANHRARLVDGPILILPLSDDVQYGFDPNNVESLDGIGTVYPTLRVSDRWGILDVTNGALMFRDGQKVSRLQVAAPTDAGAQKLKGDGWTLELKEGWMIEPAPRKGDYIIKRAS
jgi:hypothetical protein